MSHPQQAAHCVNNNPVQHCIGLLQVGLLQGAYCHRLGHEPFRPIVPIRAILTTDQALCGFHEPDPKPNQLLGPSFIQREKHHS